MKTEPKIKGLSIAETERIISKATKVVSEVIRSDPHQTGAVLVITDWAGSLLLAWLVGELSNQDTRECTLYAMEKAGRLAENSDHKASSQSRDLSVEPKRYGGAVRTNHYIYSLSGLTEEQDEAAMLVLAIATRELEVSQAVEVAYPNNTYFSGLHVKMWV